MRIIGLIQNVTGFNFLAESEVEFGILHYIMKYFFFYESLIIIQSARKKNEFEMMSLCKY